MQIKLYGSVIGLAALFAPISAVKTPFNASFDHLEGSPSANTAPVRIYYGISYAKFGVGQPGIDNESVGGVLPHSDSNLAVGFTSGASSLSIAYSGSKIKIFALDSYYYGCVTGLLQGEVENAVNCSINVNGYKAGSTKPDAMQTFDFTPAEPVVLMNAPTFGSFSTAFQGLQYANFTFAPSTLVVILIDNLIGSTQSLCGQFGNGCSLRSGRRRDAVNELTSWQIARECN